MTRSLIFATLGLSLLAADRASAQQASYGRNLLTSLYTLNSASGFSTDRIRANLVNSTVPTYNFSQVNRGVFSGAVNRPLGKPFANAGGGGSVSPWLALSDPFTSSAHNYYTQVRPQLDQQRLNQQMAARNQQMQRQLNSMAAQGPFSATGNANMAPTGHAAVFMNFGGYYTPVQPGKGR